MDKISHFKLFYKLLLINSITFGGGATIIPIIKDEFVNKNKYIKENKMNDIVALSSSIPGVMTVSASFLLGYELLGIFGAILAVLAAILPCIVILGIIALNYIKIIENKFLREILNYLSASISSLLIISTFNLFKKQFQMKKRNIYFLISFLAFILQIFFKINIVYILIVSIIFSYFYGREI